MTTTVLLQYQLHQQQFYQHPATGSISNAHHDKQQTNQSVNTLSPISFYEQ